MPNCKASAVTGKTTTEREAFIPVRTRMSMFVERRLVALQILAHSNGTVEPAGAHPGN